MCPVIILTANRSPRLNVRVIYAIISIIIIIKVRGRGVPAGKKAAASKILWVKTPRTKTPINKVIDNV